VGTLQVRRDFPREERFRLTARIEQIAFTFHESLLYAAKTGETAHHLRKADAEFDMLRTYLRFALELKYTSPDQYQTTTVFGVPDLAPRCELHVHGYAGGVRAPDVPAHRCASRTGKYIIAPSVLVAVRRRFRRRIVF
jgi:hypothetical protein